ncbi:MAG: PAS domain S-box protein [Candidatus Hydrogenedentes bacterium]|nr:PAS domain S-box protein [Candidatus Hydrogenedentota bacterium]
MNSRTPSEPNGISPGVARSVRRVGPALAPNEVNEGFTSVLDNIEESYYEVDLRGNFTFFNKATSNILGFPAEELLGMNYRQYYGEPDNIRKVRETCASVYRTGAPSLAVALDVTRKDGQQRTIEISVHLIRNAAGTPIGFRGIGRDVTERKRAEEQLRRSEERFRNYFELSLIGMAVVTPDRRWSIVNDRLCEMLGYSREELLGKTWNEVTHPEDLARNVAAINEAVDGQTPGYTIEKRYIRKDGGIIHALVSTRCVRLPNGKLDYFIALVQDITDRLRAEEERRDLETQVQHAQKLESLGVLAGGIAHDFNNLLMGVLGNAGLALLELPPDSPARRYLQEVESAALRAADLTKQMLAYSGRGKFVLQPLHVTGLIGEMKGLLTLTIAKNVSVEYHLDPGIPLIEADVAQMRQVVLNLAANASEALGDATGLVTITTGAVSHDNFSPQQSIPGGAPSGQYVFVEVSDTGCGMDELTKAKIFDPFFSTKFTGRGLGLAAVQGIVRGHHGAIDVTTEPGRGTQFRVYFPALTRKKKPGDDEQRSKTTAQPASQAGKGAILVIDDEEMIQNVTRHALERYGYTVMPALDGLAGVAVYREYQQEIVAIILDLTMPILSGAETYREIIKINPAARIILSSGYNEQDATRPFAGTQLAGFIQKPYSPSSLIRKLREILIDTGE